MMEIFLKIPLKQNLILSCELYEGKDKVLGPGECNV